MDGNPVEERLFLNRGDTSDPRGVMYLYIYDFNRQMGQVPFNSVDKSTFVSE